MSRPFSYYHEKYSRELGIESDKEFNNGGVYHRDDDNPTVITRSKLIWYKNGKIHRDGDKPAVIGKDGRRFWYRKGKLHREGFYPAVIRPNGSVAFYYNGDLMIKDQYVINIITQQQAEIVRLTKELCDVRIQTALLYEDIKIEK